MVRKNIVFASALLMSAVSFSQSVTIEGIKGRFFTGVNPIVSGVDGDVSGYYTYSQIEKAKKGMRTYQFTLVDKELSKKVEIPVELHKFAFINNTVFNGKYFLISFDDRKNKKMVTKVIDLEGTVVKTKEVLVEKKRLVGSTVYPAANGDGFYSIKVISEKNKNGFSMTKINNQLDEIWTINEVTEKGIVRCLDLVNNEDRIVIWKEVGLSIKKLKPEVVSYDAKTGQEIFAYGGYDGTSTILYNQIRIADDGAVVLGGAYVNGEKYRSVNNSGIYVLKLTKDGEKVLYTKVDNKEKIQAVLKATSTGFSVGSKDKVWVEDLILDGDEIVVVSEMFRLNMNLKPGAVQKPRDIITGKFVGDMNYSNSNGKSPKQTFEIMDYILFKFDKEGGLTEIKTLAKTSHNKVTTYYPYSNMYGLDVARNMERLGWFDYGFTIELDGQKLMVCSNNAEARKPQVFTYALDGNYTKKEIDLKQQAKVNLDDARVSYFKPIANSDGKIAVAYYQRKLKKVTINIEDLH